VKKWAKVKLKSLLVKIKTCLWATEKGAKIGTTFSIRLPKVNNHPIGKYSANLVTLPYANLSSSLKVIIRSN
jgi:hypothetical protein